MNVNLVYEEEFKCLKNQKINDENYLPDSQRILELEQRVKKLETIIEILMENNKITKRFFPSLQSTEKIVCIAEFKMLCQDVVNIIWSFCNEYTQYKLSRVNKKFNSMHHEQYRLREIQFEEYYETKPLDVPEIKKLYMNVYIGKYKQIESNKKLLRTCSKTQIIDLFSLAYVNDFFLICEQIYLETDKLEILLWAIKNNFAEDKLFVSLIKRRSFYMLRRYTIDHDVFLKLCKLVKATKSNKIFGDLIKYAQQKYNNDDMLKIAILLNPPINSLKDVNNIVLRDYEKYLKDVN